MEFLRIASSLPEEFDFYHLGKVRLRREEPKPLPPYDEILENHFAIGYTFAGEVRGALVILIEQGLDSSTYMELGNILASQIANRLNQDGVGIMISPPQELSPDRVRKLIRSNKVIDKTYVHMHDETMIQVRSLLIVADNPAGETAHA